MSHNKAQESQQLAGNRTSGPTRVLWAPCTGERNHDAAAVLEMIASGCNVHECAISVMPVKT